jgi:mannosyltransferase
VTALVLGLYRLATPSLWRDEAYSIDAARRPAGEILAMLGHVDAVNGTYYLLLHPVIAAFGTSATAIRLPSVLAMAVAAAVTAALGRRLALLAALPSPSLSGAAAGLFLAVAPMTTRYAQEARAYAFVTLTAVTASYLLVRALTRPRWYWWAAYALALVASGLFNVLSLLLAAAHAVTMLIVAARRRAAAPPGAPPVTSRPWRWLAAVAAALAVLSPLLVLGYQERKQISWLRRPALRAVADLAASLAGSKQLIVPVAVIALAGVAAGLAGRRRAQVPPAAVALPWLVLPPLVLLGVSQVSPLYDFRYVLYCLPALALLVAAGLSWLTRLTVRAVPAAGAAAWLPALGVAACLGLALIPPQQQVRLPSSRPDNLRALAALLAARERPGDGVLYLPPKMWVVSLAYPAPFRGLPNVGLAASPVAVAALTGTSVSPAVLQHRLAHLARLWVVGGTRLPARVHRHGARPALLAGWRQAGRWPEGKVVLHLYVRR